MTAPKTHCPRGHEYTEENTALTPKGWKYCKTCKREKFGLWREKQTPDGAERIRKNNRESQRELLQQRRRLVNEAYGGACTCCGETEPLFLTVEHLNDDGAEHRRLLSPNSGDRGSGSMPLLKNIIDRGFPPEFTLRCYNCNCGRSRNGGVCPHELHRVSDV